jgi:hypothetical protein
VFSFFLVCNPRDALPLKLNRRQLGKQRKMLPGKSRDMKLFLFSTTGREDNV